MLMKHTTASGFSLSWYRPGDITFFDGDIGFSYWKLLRLPEGPLYTTTNILAICLPSFFTFSVSLFEEGFRENPNEPHHTRAYGLLNRCDRVNARGSQRIFQSDTSILPCLSGLFPLSDLWYSCLLAVTSAVYVWTLRLTHALSCAWTTSKLCRWLAGVYQRITAPLFYSVNFLQSIFIIITGFKFYLSLSSC